MKTRLIMVIVAVVMACTVVGQNQNAGSISNPLPAPKTVQKGTQCTGITAKGTRCTRMIAKGTTCSQHAKNAKRTYYSGANGGVYYLSAKGNKVYVKK